MAFREQGGKVVTMRVGNDYGKDSERMVFDTPHRLLISGAPYVNVKLPYLTLPRRVPNIHR